MKIMLVVALAAWRAEASCISGVGACFCSGQSAAVVVTEGLDGGAATVRVETATRGLDAGERLTLATESGEAVGDRWFFTSFARSPIDGAGKVQCAFLAASVSVDTALEAASSPASCVATLEAQGIKNPPCRDNGCATSPVLGSAALVLAVALRRRRASA